MQNLSRRPRRFVLLGLMLILVPSAPAMAETSSPWVEGFKNKIRLLAGEAQAPGGIALPYAAIEIEMPAGWKTYWRTPGEAGGIPPEFDFAESLNLAKATVLYPAPKKLPDKAGITFGYKDHVIFPIAIVPKDKAAPVTLKLKASYGVCKELCVPAEAEVQIDIESKPTGAGEITDWLARVPTSTPQQGSDPVVARVERIEEAGKAILRITATDTDASQTEAFVDTADSDYFPAPKKRSGDGNTAVFDVDLTDGVDIAEVSKKPVIITLTGAKGQSETTVALP